MRKKLLISLSVCLAVIASTQMNASVVYKWYYALKGNFIEYTGEVTDKNADDESATAGKGIVSYNVPVEKIGTDYYLSYDDPENRTRYDGVKLYGQNDGMVYGLPAGVTLVDVVYAPEYYNGSVLYTGKKYYDKTEQVYYGASGQEVALLTEPKVEYVYTAKGDLVAYRGVVYTNPEGLIAGYVNGKQEEVYKAETGLFYDAIYKKKPYTYVYTSELIRTENGVQYGCIDGTEVELKYNGLGSFTNKSDGTEYNDPVLLKDGRYYGCWWYYEITKGFVYYKQNGEQIYPGNIQSVTENGGEITITYTWGGTENNVIKREAYLSGGNVHTGDVLTKTIDGVEHYYGSNGQYFEIEYHEPEGDVSISYIDPVSHNELPYTGKVYKDAQGQNKGYVGGEEVRLNELSNVYYRFGKETGKYVALTASTDYIAEIDGKYFNNTTGTPLPLTKYQDAPAYFYSQGGKDVVYTGNVYEDNTGYLKSTEFPLTVKNIYTYNGEAYTGPLTADGKQGVDEADMDAVTANVLALVYKYRYTNPFTDNSSIFESLDPALSSYTIDNISVDVTRKVAGVVDDDPSSLRITIGTYNTILPVKYENFAEPTVLVKNGNDNVSSQYNITYGFLDGETETVTNDRGIEVVRHIPTGTTVSKYQGQVSTNGKGEVMIEITATPKSGSGETLHNAYPLSIEADEAKAVFAPAFLENNSGEKYIKLPVTKLQMGHVGGGNEGDLCYILNPSKSVLPQYSLTTTSSAGVVSDITDCFNVEISLVSESDKVTYKEAEGRIEYAGMGSVYEWQTQTDAVVEPELTELEDYTGQLRYRFVPKAEYAGIYDVVEENISISFKINRDDQKGKLHLSLPHGLFTEDNVTGNDYDANYPDETGYTIHVYKYGTGMGGGDDHYHYQTPNPALMTEEGTELPTSSAWGGGAYGDFNLVYQIVKDSTYLDDCQDDFFRKTQSATHIEAGQKTGLSISDYSFQTSLPGLVKVAVYAALPANNKDYGIDLRNAFEPIKDAEGNEVILDSYGAKYVAYTEPVYFYIDVMKRVPKLVFEPDPNTIVFVKGDKVHIPSRFTVHGEIDDSSNGLEGYLIWGGSGSSVVDGKEVDHFSYDFFVSDRLDQKIRVNDWPKDPTWDAEGGDDHSYIDWVASLVNTNYDIRVGDKILVDGEYVLITEDNISLYPGRKLLKGDLERGVTYRSMKDWGNEKWTMEFLQTGKYTIPYTIRPWNHTRWDAGMQYAVDFDIDDSKVYKTQIELGYDFQTATVNDGSNFLEPTTKVVVPTMGNYDITDKYTLTYTIDADDATTGTTIDAETGQVTVGTKVGDVIVRVHAERKTDHQTSDEVFENPNDAFYTIHIVNGASLARWEVISTCKDEDPCEAAEDGRYVDMTEANGRFHFLSTGDIFGGTTIYSVPGIAFTVGAKATSTSEAEWHTAETQTAAKVCCQHEVGHTCVYVEGTTPVLLEDGIPASGSFFKFVPVVNGFLTVDANFPAGHIVRVISKNSKDGSIVEEDFVSEEGIVGDHTFEKAMLAGETYYLYDVTANGTLRMHGFAYQPAFVMDRNTNKKDSENEIAGVTFVNGLSTGIPTLSISSNLNVSYEVYCEDEAVNVADYVTVNNVGALSPKKMTMTDEGDVFSLKVKGTVNSSDATLGSCVAKTTVYDLRILDIPTFAVTEEVNNPDPGSVVTTTNIPTAIAMTFGGWKDRTTGDDKYGDKEINDSWEYKNTPVDGVGRPADRIGNEIAPDAPEYNKTIDGFKYFVGASQNPVDEKNRGVLHNNTYTFASGTAADLNDNRYNTTYNVPCRGAFVKFEPRESGDLLVYLVQNGCVDYYDGYTKTGGQQIAWRPLFITDETGRPVEMITKFGDMSASLLPTGADIMNPGSFTLGISRSNKVDNNVKALWNYDPSKAHGTSYDWSEKFLGTEADITRLIESWPDKGKRESVIRLDNGGFTVAHKAYVRYGFKVKAGKTYYVFQQGSKFELGGFSFVPAGFPDKCKYNLKGDENDQNQETDFAGNAFVEEGQDLTFTWDDKENFNESRENICITINDRRKSELTSAADKNVLKARTFEAGKWEGICLPFSVSSSEAKRVFGEGYQVVTCESLEENGEGKTLNFVRHANTYIEAGRPYLVKPSQAGKFEFRNVTIEGDVKVPTAGGEMVSVTDPERFEVNLNDEYIFQGIYKRETMPKLSYFVKDDGLYRYANDTKIGGYRSYFKIVDGAASTASLSFSIKDLVDGEDEDAETGIMYIDNEGVVETLPANSAIYSVDGQKVGEGADALNAAARGVYVAAGKKIVK